VLLIINFLAFFSWKKLFRRTHLLLFHYRPPRSEEIVTYIPNVMHLIELLITKVVMLKQKFKYLFN